MILLEIDKIGDFKPISKTLPLSNFDEGQRYISMLGNFPEQPETGSLSIEVKLLSGDIRLLRKVKFISMMGVKGDVIEVIAKGKDKYHITVKIDDVLAHGLELSSKYFIQSALVIGMTSEQLVSNELDIPDQRELLSYLLKSMLPKHKDRILKLAKLGYIIEPMEEHSQNQSYFGGHEKLSIKRNDKERELSLVMNISFGDFEEVQWPNDRGSTLKIFFQPNNEEDDWPNNAEDLNLLMKYSNSSNQENETIAVSKKLVLDIPTAESSHIISLNLNDDDEEQYYELFETYTDIIYGGNGSEKIKLRGYPVNIQNCVAYEAERIFFGRDHSRKLFKDGENWQLLLQINQDQPFNFEFLGDLGDITAYIMVREDDFIKGDLSKCVLISQGT